MRPLSHYLRHSLILHAGVLVLAGVAGMIGARSETRQMKFVILPNAFSIDGGELTPTLKLKRKAVAEKYAREIESMYVAEVEPAGLAPGRENAGHS